MENGFNVVTHNTSQKNEVCVLLGRGESSRSPPERYDDDDDDDDDVSSVSVSFVFSFVLLVR